MIDKRTRITPIIKTSLAGFKDRIGVKRDIEDYAAWTITAYMKKCGFKHFTVPSVEQQQIFSSEFVGTHPWPGWHPKSLFAVTLKDYNDAYELPPIATTQCFLIPEVTASIARYVAGDLTSNNPALKKGLPFKVYYSQSCFRNELISQLSERKLREFTQIGLEFMGQGGVEIDLEVITVAVESLLSLGFKRKDVLIRLNDVRLFNYLAELCKFGADEQNEIKTTLDSISSARIKHEKKILNALIEKYITCITAKKIAAKYKKLWATFLLPYLTGSGLSGVINKFPKFIYKDLGALVQYGEQLGLNVVVDLSVVRSQEYYNGIVFQIDILGGKRLTAEVGGGGRYDYFVNKLIEGQNHSINSVFPATGYAFSLERISMAIVYSGLMINRNVQMPTAGIDYVIAVSPKSIESAYYLANILREKGFIVVLANSKSLSIDPEEYARSVNAKFLPT